MAPSKSNLMKAAHEGFAMLDEYFEKKRGKVSAALQPTPPSKQNDYINKYQRQPQKPHAYQVLVPAPATNMATVTNIDCYEAARLFNGTVIVDYPNTKKPPMRLYA